MKSDTNKSVAMILFVFSVVVLFCGCTHVTTIGKQTKLHDEITDIETSVLDDYGEYIVFDGFRYDIDIDTGEKVLQLPLLFITDYLNDENALNDHGIAFVIDGVTNSINKYIKDNPGCYLDNCRFSIAFFIAHDGSKYSQANNVCVARIKNFYKGEKFESLCVLGIEEESGTILSDSTTDMKSITVMKCVNLGIDCKSEIVTIAERLPNLKTIYVNDEEVGKAVQEQLTDIEIRWS